MAEIFLLSECIQGGLARHESSDVLKRFMRIWSEGAAILPGSARNPAGATQQSE